MKYSNFPYIDVALGGVENRNNLMKSDEINGYARKWLERNKSYVDCYKTYWLYPNAMVEHFSKLKSVSGYDGALYSEFLPLDIDSNDLICSIQTTKEILLYLEREFQLDLKTVLIYFSGAKGFHLELLSELFGFEPSPFLHETFKKIVKRILPDGITVDEAIYDKVRLWRIPNTINSKSGLYKIRLSVDELFNLTIPEIKDLAKRPRKGVFSDNSITLNSALHRLHLEVREEVLKRASEPKNTGDRRYKEFLQEGAKEGERNNALTSYGGKLRALGIPEEEAKVILKSLNQTGCKPPLEEKEVEAILNSAYRYETDTKRFEFKTTSWQDLLGKEEPQIEFLIDDLLPIGNLIILGGKPKLGKSLLSLLCALSVGLGKSLWGKKVAKGTVLFVSTEDGEVRLKKRIWKMLSNPVDYQPNFHFYCGDCVITKKDVFETLRTRIIELKPKLIVLDPLINLFRGRDLNKAEDMNEVLRPLQTLAKENGACVLVIHHARKSTGDDTIDMIQGSITISGVADGILLLRSLRGKEDEKLATLEVILKDAEIPKKVVLKLDDNLRWNVEGEFNEVMSQNLEVEVIKILKDETNLTIKDLMQFLEAEYKPLYRCLLKLEEDKKVKVEKVGKFHTKYYSLENEWKTKMENEKPSVTDGNNLEKYVSESSFSKIEKVENDGKRNEKLENEIHFETCDCDQCCPNRDVPDYL